MQKLLSHFFRHRIFYLVLALLLLFAGGTLAYIYYNWYQGEPAETAQEAGSSPDSSISSSPEDSADSPPTDSDSTVHGPAGSSPSPASEPPSGPVPEALSAYVAFYSDSQSDTDAEDIIHQTTLGYLLAIGANPVIHAGDVMEDGTAASLNRFNTVAATLLATRTFYAALGNNDRQVGDPSTPSPLFLANFSFPGNERWYSVNIGNFHLVVLDSAFAAANPDQINWLVADLSSAASSSRITGVVFHHPTFIPAINSYLETYGVDFVVAGHVHSYGRSQENGVYYFTSSGMPGLGYMTAKIYSTYLVVTAYDSSNSVVETVTFSAR